MKKFPLMCYVAIATIFIGTSCGNSKEPPPSVNTPYFKTKEGSKWVFSNYHLYQDSAGTVSQLLDENDTLAQNANATVLGQSAMMMRHRFVNLFPTYFASTANYSMYEDESANKVFVNSEFMKVFLPDIIQEGWGVVFDEKWFLLADGRATTEWIIDSFTLSNAEIPGLDGTTLNGSLKFGVKRDKDTVIVVNDIDNTANTYTLSIFFEGYINYPPYPYLSAIKIRMEFKQINFYLAVRKGILGVHSPVNNLTVAPVGSPIGSIPLPMVLEGFDKRLISIHIESEVPM